MLLLANENVLPQRTTANIAFLNKVPPDKKDDARDPKHPRCRFLTDNGSCEFVMESVWDYPRPPRIEAVPKRLEVVFAGRTIASTTQGLRVLETSHPPVYYFPPTDVEAAVRTQAAGTSWCEFKGKACYWSLHLGDKSADRAAWSYPNPIDAYSEIAGCFAFYASQMDKCFVGDQLVSPQQGDFYGGWITEDLKGPFKGAPGSVSW